MADTAIFVLSCQSKIEVFPIGEAINEFIYFVITLLVSENMHENSLKASV